MKIDVEKLRKLTQEVQDKAAADKANNERIKAAFEEQERLKRESENKLKAQGIINTIPFVTTDAAKKGNNSAIVCDLGETSKLDIVGQTVFDYCKDNGLRPEVVVTLTEYDTHDHDGWGRGMTQYYGIKVSW